MVAHLPSKAARWQRAARSASCFSAPSGTAIKLQPMALCGLPRAMVFEGDAAIRRAVVAIMGSCGFTVLNSREPPADLVGAVTAVRPDLLVLELALTGSRGVGIVRPMLDAVPGCAVVLLSPFERLRAPALEGGAYGLVGRDDLRDLDRCLRRLQTDCGRRQSPGPHHASGDDLTDGAGAHRGMTVSVAPDEGDPARRCYPSPSR